MSTGQGAQRFRVQKRVQRVPTCLYTFPLSSVMISTSFLVNDDDSGLAPHHPGISPPLSPHTEIRDLWDMILAVVITVTAVITKSCLLVITDHVSSYSKEEVFCPGTRGIMQGNFRNFSNLSEKLDSHPTSPNEKCWKRV